jgi:hypothetical protein
LFCSLVCDEKQTNTLDLVEMSAGGGRPAVTLSDRDAVDDNARIAYT